MLLSPASATAGTFGNTGGIPSIVARGFFFGAGALADLAALRRSSTAFESSSISPKRIRIPGRSNGPVLSVYDSLTEPLPANNGSPSASVTQNLRVSPTGLGVRVAMKMLSPSQKRLNTAMN